MTHPIVITERCHYCSKFRSPAEIQPIGTGGAKICWRCLEWHDEALRMLNGRGAPRGCQDCGVTFAELKARTAADVRMYLHQKDGIYQILCRLCSDRYIPKRRDLYGPTLFGKKLSLIR